MENFRSYCRCARRSFAKIHLVDKCLIIFMFVLLIQSAYSLFFSGGDLTDMSKIDVVIRTSIAAIFGYFLSANFVRRSNDDMPPDLIVKTPEILENSSTKHLVDIRNRIGFSVDSSDPSKTETGMGKGVPESGEHELLASNHLQILIATTIGVFCLIILILLRNIEGLSKLVESSSSATATVAQFRDIVSGCVGFLIGSPTNNK